MIAATAMRATRHRNRLPRRFVWLLWLALLVPLAQSVAKWHGVSHAVSAAGGQPDGTQAPHDASCGLCLAAAAVGGAAAPGATPPLLHPALHDALPQAAVDGIWSALLQPAYLSRAPPVAAH